MTLIQFPENELEVPNNTFSYIKNIHIGPIIIHPYARYTDFSDKNPNKIYCASVGTCRCVLFTLDKSYIITYGHTSNSESEVNRISSTNKGEVRPIGLYRNDTSGDKNEAKNEDVDNPPNIFFPYRDHKKGLNLTRCFGYFYYERN